MQPKTNEMLSEAQAVTTKELCLNKSEERRQHFTLKDDLFIFQHAHVFAGTFNIMTYTQQIDSTENLLRTVNTKFLMVV